MASTLMANQGKAEVDISNLPGGIQDACILLSATTNPTMKKKGNINNAATSFQEKDSEKPTWPMGQGQLGKVAVMAALSACLQKATKTSNHIMQERHQGGGTRVKSAIKTTKRKLVSEPGSYTAQPFAATTKLWMRIMDYRLKEIRSYHARNANNEASKIGIPFDNDRHKNSNKRLRFGSPGADGYDLASSVVESLGTIQDGNYFSSEEVMGKYMDLQPIYESYVIPIKSIMQTKPFFGYSDFLTFLSKGESGLIEGIPENIKLKERKKYARFLVALENYLEDFLRRTQPLLSKNQITDASVKDFEEKWSKIGGSPGWESKPSETFLAKRYSSADDNVSSDQAMLRCPKIDVSSFGSAADLEKAYDGDMLKAELIRLGLKCGGTVADRAKRLFLTKKIPLSELPKKLKTKALSPKSRSEKAIGTLRLSIKNERRFDIAKREVVVMCYLNQLKLVLGATTRRIDRRETQTTKEREREMAEDLYGSLPEDDAKRKSREGKYSCDDDSGEEDAPIYNPKGVPLGWDGKPIPYWLFKLHGLNHFYKCEICGGESYRGRKNFETHFAESRHSHGMKSLGIPNTKHFHGVTRIEDAQNLWKKLQDQLDRDRFDGTNEEEYEDSNGNVLSRATYEDLARQGLL